MHSGGITFICQQYLHVVEHMSWWGCTTIDVLAGGKSVLLCVDAVQFAYNTQRTGSTDFWNQLKRLERGPSAEHGTRVVMAASYGAECSAANIAEPHSPATTSVKYPDMVVTIFPSPNGASLQLSEEEWEELWVSYREHTQLQLGNLIKDHVWSISGRQVGACELVYIWRHHLAQMLEGHPLDDCCGAGWAVDSLSGLPKGAAGQ